MSETIEAKELQLVSIFGDNYRFEIPEYQRPYAWTTEQTGELLDDLLHAMGDVGSVSEASPYFLGSIVIIQKGLQPQAQIVDGQQRITTLTILLCVLRELASEESDRGDIHSYVYAPGRESAGIPGHYRLAVRDSEFFQNNIQQMGRLRSLLERSPANLSDSQQRMLENARHLFNSLAGHEERRRKILMQFIAQRCYLVVVSASDQNSAYRIFSVLNDRGLDLSPTDILKADIIGALPKNVRSQHTEIWEEIEEDFGRDRFGDLFAHIRTISMKRRQRGTLQQEFHDHVLKAVDRADFVVKVLEPYAEAYATVTGASYASAGGPGEVNTYLRYLNRLGNFDWIPPAMAFYRRNQYPEAFLRFVRDLERLAYAMFIVRTPANRRTSRYANILRAIDQKDDLHGVSSPLQLSSREIADVLSALDGPIGSLTQVRRTLLLRLDSLLADGGARYEHATISIEHVLPRNPERNSQWLRDFPDEEEREEWTDRLANLVLLSRTKNSRAQNHDFERKKREYFQRGGVVTFALTSQVLAEEEWTPAVLQRRRRELINVLKKEWRLEQASPSPPVHVLQEQSKPTYNVEKVQGESHRVYDQTKQPLQKNLTAREEFDATVIAQDILKAVIQTEERFGIRHVADVLRGSKNKKVKKWRHDSLPAYGTVNGYSADEITEIADQLIEEGMLYRGGGRYPTLSVTQAGKDFLKLGEALTLTSLSRRRKGVREVSTYEETKQLWKQGLSVEQIAKERSLEKSTIAFHLEHLIEEGMDIDLRPMLPPMEKVEEIKKAFEEMGGNLLPPVKELLGDEYSYYEIKIVWVFLRQQGELPS
ncbi:MAG: DUF262 domain-containing protein [Caldilineaceae bacterium SB0668_bin_21]|nr:DUF262 domain-containing protein [Caldilineaceae bacterium SB0668_bin_21]